MAVGGSTSASFKSRSERFTLTRGWVCFPAGDELMRCVDLYNQTQSKWFEEMVTTCMVTSCAFAALLPWQRLMSLRTRL